MTKSVAGLKLAAISALVASAASGCTAAQTVQFAVSRYCGLSSEARAVSRDAVALVTTPNRIEIHCHE